jgi:hypothetical protein
MELGLQRWERGARIASFSMSGLRYLLNSGGAYVRFGVPTLR